MFKVCQRCFINGFFIDGQTQKKRSCFRAFKVCLGVLYLLILAGITTRCEEFYSNNDGSIISTLDIFKQHYLMLQVCYSFLPLLTSYFHLKQPPYSVSPCVLHCFCNMTTAEVFSFSLIDNVTRVGISSPYISSYTSFYSHFIVVSPLKNTKLTTFLI